MIFFLKHEFFKMNTVEKEIFVDVVLSPSDLKYDIKDIVFEKVVSKMKSSAFEEHGIITDIKKIKSIEHQRITETSTAIYTVASIIVDCYRPRVSDIIKCKIRKIFNYGLFFSDKQLRVLIPISTINSDWTLEKMKDDYILTSKTTNSQLLTDSEVPIQIQDVRFEKNGFSCIAKMI